ncbi:unnamed protein product [Anisakis simplex]|uniref:Uncharacterized protein n=1 Tax=Anisakis simplex TaxID=6269 RepID=A0A3P6N9K0_ANISI|nr:unnamed protein product [Anisakis simplex]
MEIFSRVLISAIDAVLAEHRRGPMTEAYEKAFAELVRVVCHSEHTYLYAQTLLHVISEEEEGMSAAACSHIAQALRMVAHEREQDTSALYVALLQSNDEQIAPNLIQAMHTMMNKKCLNPADITQLYQQYVSSNPPPIELIREPLFIDMLIDSLFAYDGVKVHTDHRPKYVYLLAYAACVGEKKKNGVRSQARQELDTTRDAIERLVTLLESADDLLKELNQLLFGIRLPVVAAGLLHYLRGNLLSDDVIGEPEPQARQELDTTRDAIERLVTLLESADDLLKELNQLLFGIRLPVVAAGLLHYLRGNLLSDDVIGEPEPELDTTRDAIERLVTLLESADDLLKELNQLLFGIRLPVVAAGLLHYLRGNLLSDDVIGEPEPVHLVLLDQIATSHPNLHMRVFGVLCELYDRQSSMQEAAEVIMERQRIVIDRFVHLLSVGLALPVIEKVNRMFRDGQIDSSLVRYFAVEVLEIVAPPYSQDFVNVFLPIVSNQEIFDQNVHDKLPAAKEFIEQCTATTC